MMLKGLLLLGAVFALSDAFPWRYSNLFHAEQQTHEVARTTPVRDSICKSVDGPTGGISLQSTDIHVCDFTTQDVCVYLSPGSERLPCCGSLTITGERIASELTERVTVGDTEYFVRFYVESEGSCYVVKEVVGGALAPLCVSDARCQPGCVDLPNTICEIGVVSCVDGVCTCLDGYAGPDCCDCDLSAGFYRNTTTGECLPCDCCTFGTVDGKIQCSVEGCNCAEGYEGFSCCNCTDGFYRPEDPNECSPCLCCVDGTDDSSITCDATGDCGGCATGFFGDKCCDPCNCCPNGTVGGTDVCDNENGTCTCATGYTGDKCCNCADGFYRPPGTQVCLPCECCIDGTDDSSITCDATGNCETCRNGFSGDKCCNVTRPCATDTDFYFLVDTTRSYNNDDLCLQTYTMMEIVTALDLGTGENQSLVGNILYPAARPNEDTPATYLNRLGDTDADNCSEVVQKLEDLQVDIFRGIFENRRTYTPIYATRGDRTLPQNAITLLAQALDKRPLTDRRIAGVVLTDGEHDNTSLSLEAARNLLPAELDLIAAGVGKTAEERNALMDDLQIIAGNPANIIVANSIPDLANSTVTLLIRKGIICPDDGENILNRIATNNFIDAQRYCTCLQNRYSGMGCTNTLVKPACPAPTLAEEMYSKVKDEEVLEEEILDAVENVLKHHGH